MSDYTKAVNYATKDGLTAGDPNKKIKGTELNTEYDNIQTAVNSKPDDPTTTTGDIIYNSGATTQARLGIGTAGQALATNSGATAPEWIDMPGWQVVTAATALGTETEIEVTTAAGFDYRLELYDIDPSADANLEWEVEESASYVTDTNEYRNAYLQVLGTTVSGTADSNGNVIINTLEGTQTNAWDSWMGWLEFRQCNDANITTLVEYNLNGEDNGGSHLLRSGFARRDSAVAGTKVKILLTAGTFGSSGYYVVYRRINGT